MPGAGSLGCAIKIVAIILASLCPLVMSWPCVERNAHCHWQQIYECVEEDEKGCPCFYEYYGPECRKGQRYSIRCAKSLGMAHNVRNISDEQLNATSWLDENFSPQQGRLYNPTAAWCAHNLDTQPIFTVTLEKTYMLIAAHIQGDPVNGKNFPRILSIDTQKPGSGFVNVFNGGVHIGGKKNAKFWIPFRQYHGKVVQFKVLTYEGDYACMRVELYGCYRDVENPRNDVDCFETLGVKDSAIFPDSSFSASSNAPGTKPWHARLDGDGSWCPEDDDMQPTLNIELPDVNKHIFAIATQGGSGPGSYARYLTIFKDDAQRTLNKKQVC